MRNIIQNSLNECSEVLARFLNDPESVSIIEKAATLIADALEKACIKTIEDGKMTKDLALMTTIPNPTVLNSADFIKAIRTELEKNM